MARKRVHEIAKAKGLTSKEVLAALKAAGIQVTAAASSVEEEDAIKALSSAAKGDGAGVAAKADGKKETKAKAAKPASSGGAQSKPARRPVRRREGGGTAGGAKAGG